MPEGDNAKEVQLLETWKAYKKNFLEGVALFNAKPKKGIAFMQASPGRSALGHRLVLHRPLSWLCRRTSACLPGVSPEPRRWRVQEQRMLGRSPEEVARFLAKSSGLDKTMIGEYLGEREDGCIQVMHAYINALDFAGADFDAAIRCGVQPCRLPLRPSGRLSVASRQPRPRAESCPCSSRLAQSGRHAAQAERTRLRAVEHLQVAAPCMPATAAVLAGRRFLSGFRLPGEAQKIDRLMEKFAERYVSCNQEAFKSADVAYVLAYSVVMLNTDAHNPQARPSVLTPVHASVGLPGPHLLPLGHGARMGV